MFLIIYIQSVNSLFDNQPDSVGIDKPFAYLIGNPNFNTYINQNIDESNLLERGVDDSTLYKIKNTIKLTSLPGTKKEINSIYEILKNNDYKVLSYMYDSANEKNIKNIQSPFLLHIATHGYFLPNDKLSKMKESIFNIHNKINGDDPYFKSGLLLAGAQNTINKKFSNNEDNGILTAVEVKELYLKNTELVVLSACETGLGVNFVGEGMIGLPRAFMIAGAKSVIMSLWSVSDEKTQELMVLFYTNFITKKMNKQDALYYAKKEIKSKYNRPFYWGAFVLID
jgi:CHAT domain-containing protein